MSIDPAPLEHRLTAFGAALGHELDPFQVAAIRALDAGMGVLVAAPTGAGKTVVADWCVADVLARGGRCFTTTPIKALSNQKFRDLVDAHGPESVGLLTGDRSVRGDAPVVVMTTEVLRNMIYDQSRDLDELRHVVLDEVHYLADRTRGSVWEEVLIQLPRHIQITALSATVSNAEEFGEWLDQVRGGVEVVISEDRPVPLRHHYFVNDELHPTFTAGDKGRNTAAQRDAAARARGGVPNPKIRMLERNASRGTRVTRSGRRVRTGPRMRWPSRPQVVDELAGRGWLPAIMFVFSRAGCDKAVDQLITAGVSLTTAAQRRDIEVLADTLLADLPPEDLAALDVDRFTAALARGVAAHHAGMVPVFKEVVEECFQRGLLGVVVATETLALGINMPAKTVVIERLEKWNGESHELLTPGQYTQLTGRAGRRGIDSVGNAVVLYQRDLDFRTVAGLVGTRTYPLRSSFTPSYNMVVNLLSLHPQQHAEALLGRSFAQFQADRSVADLEERLARARQDVDGLATAAVCDRGDFGEYWDLREDLSRSEKESARDRRRSSDAAQRDGLRALVPGDVLALPWIGRRGLAAVTGVRMTRAGVPLADVVADNRVTQVVGPRELDGAPPVVDRIELPRTGGPGQRDYRNQVADALATVAASGVEAPSSPAPAEDNARDTIAGLRAAVRAHPCHTCADLHDHEAWARRTNDQRRTVQKLERQIEQRTGSLVRQFRQLTDVLRARGLLTDDLRPTPVGMTLADIHADVALLVAEGLANGAFDDLDHAELAAAVATLTYESRTDEPPPQPRLATPTLGEWYDRMQSLAVDIRRTEQAHGVPPTRELDPTIATVAWRWATGADFDTAVGSSELTGGDFVRTIKQVADLVGQIRSADPERASVAGRTMGALRRGIVEA